MVILFLLNTMFVGTIKAQISDIGKSIKLIQEQKPFLEFKPDSTINVRYATYSNKDYQVFYFDTNGICECISIVFFNQETFKEIMVDVNRYYQLLDNDIYYVTTNILCKVDTSDSYPIIYYYLKPNNTKG